jgi:hypothetical protein
MRIKSAFFGSALLRGAQCFRRCCHANATKCSISCDFFFELVEKFPIISIRHLIPMDSKTECANYLRHCGYGSI